MGSNLDTCSLELNLIKRRTHASSDVVLKLFVLQTGDEGQVLITMIKPNRHPTSQTSKCSNFFVVKRTRVS